MCGTINMMFYLCTVVGSYDVECTINKPIMHMPSNAVALWHKIKAKKKI